MIIPFQDIPADTLNNLLETFITREGTDYGAEEMTLEAKLNQLRTALISKVVVVVFDEDTDTFNILRTEEIDKSILNECYDCLPVDP